MLHICMHVCTYACIYVCMYVCIICLYACSYSSFSPTVFPCWLSISPAVPLLSAQMVLSSACMSKEFHYTLLTSLSCSVTSYFCDIFIFSALTKGVCSFKHSVVQIYNMFSSFIFVLMNMYLSPSNTLSHICF